MSCAVGCRLGSDPAWLWLEATAPIGPLALEPPYAASAALKAKKKKKSIFKVKSRPNTVSMGKSKEAEMNVNSLQLCLHRYASTRPTCKVYSPEFY